MKSIRKRRNGYALLLLVSICLSIWLGIMYMTEATLALLAISIIFALLLARQSRLLYYARLIWDNPILVLASAPISMEGQPMIKDREEIVISTFGILVGREIYSWGLDGACGVGLHTVQIDKERLYLTFGKKGQETIQLELLHGIREKQLVLDAAQELLDETGVMAEIIGW